MSTDTLEAEDVTIESRDDLEEVVELIGNYTSDLERTQAAQDKAIRRAKRKHSDKLNTLQDLVNELKAKAIDYARNHKGELLEGTDGKTVELMTGDIQFQKGRKRVVFTDDKDEIIERLIEAGREDLVTFSQRLSKRTILKHFKEIKNIKGIKVERSEEKVQIKPLVA